ncbi:Replication factor A protein 2, variant 2 [Entomophthora muscae]|uniref:Replication factor A protein 2, variant 2 n=1 Tax=Entomophthora muscae TaxID=34485 RepID=A0ACC2UJB1_9FUNG|nr:Replication factor A protein 2, variant 2 [Entomophthora muscae]
MNYGNNSNSGYGHNQGGMSGYPSYNNSGMGGFSNDTSINNYGSAIDSEAPVKKPKNMSLRHVTIRQINSLAVPEDKDAPFIMDGEEISQVVLVAALSSPPESQAASLTLSVEDGTGFLDVRFWTSTASGEVTPLSQQIESINPRTYIQIIGGLKTFGNKISINGIHVRAITDPNEIHMHYLECIHTYLMLAGTKKVINQLTYFDFLERIFHGFWAE